MTVETRDGTCPRCGGEIVWLGNAESQRQGLYWLCLSCDVRLEAPL